MSVLALVETIAAMSVYAYIALRFGPAHLTIAASLAPLMLLRTNESVRFALFHSVSFRKNELKRPTPFPRPITQSVVGMLLILICAVALLPMFLKNAKDLGGGYVALSIGAFFLLWSTGLFALFVFVFMPLLMRVLATLHGVYIDPLRAIRNIPSNWWQQVACLDTFHPPEVLPGAILQEDREGNISQLQPYGYFLAMLITVFQSHDSFIQRLRSSLIAAGGVMMYLTAAIPTYIFRFSIKGTALLLLPLIWLVHDASTTKPEYYVKSTVVKGTFNVSCSVLLVVAGFTCMRVVGTDFGLTSSLEKVYLLRDTNPTVRAFFPADSACFWQLVAVTLSCISVSTFLFAERLSIRGSSPREVELFKHLVSINGLGAVLLIFSLLATSAAETL
jgi:hypothetical protein